MAFAFQNNAFQNNAFQAQVKRGGQSSKYIKQRREDEAVIMAVIHSYMKGIYR